LNAQSLSDKVYTVYKTVCRVNGKYYLGVHKTNKPHDSYLGSGKHLQLAVTKYGRENFTKEVLFVYCDATSAYAKEWELLQVCLGDTLCMNLTIGGRVHGWEYVNREGLSLGFSYINGSNLGSYLDVEHQRKAGRVSGRNNVESGHLRNIAPAGAAAQPLEAKIRGGQTQGRRAAASGQLASARNGITHEDRIQMGKQGSVISNHIRWHVNRGIMSSRCALCRK
jgi:hypothetical protein